jgi:hypothetical protein
MDYAYLAGLLDGEGTFTIYWEVKHGGFLQPAPAIVLSLKSNEREVALINSIVEELGGTVTTFRENKNGKGGLIRWQLWDKQTLRKVLEGIKPYLRLRREECCLLLEALDVIEGDPERLLLGFRKEAILKLAEITEKLCSFNTAKRIRKKWTYEYIKNYVEKAPQYSEEYRLKHKKAFLESGVQTRFKKGVPLPEEVKEKMLKNVREANKRRAKYPDEVVKEARRLYKEGGKPFAIAKKLNINPLTVYDWLKKGRRGYAV